MNPAVKEMAWLIDNIYFVENAIGWCRAVKPPAKRDLARYVSAIKTLGAWSTSTHVGDVPPVEVSTGSRPDEILFRLRGGR